MLSSYLYITAPFRIGPYCCGSEILTVFNLKVNLLVVALARTKSEYVNVICGLRTMTQNNTELRREVNVFSTSVDSCRKNSTKQNGR